MIRRLAALASAGVLTGALVTAAAVPAQAAGSFYMQLKGYSLYIENTGAGQLVQLSTATTYYTEVAEGGGWFMLEDEYGDCLNIGSNGYGYSNSCEGTTTEQWSKSGYQFKNRHYATLLNSIGVSGEYVFLSNDSGNAGAQWATPGA